MQCKQGLGESGARIAAARAAFYLERYDEAVALAKPLLEATATESDRGDAHAVMGSALFAQGHNSAAQKSFYADAKRHLVEAVALHEKANNPGATGRDLQQLAGLAFKAGDMETAIADVSRAASLAKAANDPRLYVYTELARVDLLRAIGQYDVAEAAAQAAIDASADPSDRALARTKLGFVLSEGGHLLFASAVLEQALREEQASHARPRQLQAIYLNLSIISSLLADPVRAYELVEKAREAGTDEFTYRFVRGSAGEAAGQFEASEADFAQAQSIHAEPESEWGWRLHYARARVALARGQIDSAIELDRLAIARISELAIGAGNLGSTFVAKHRAPHLHVLEILARRGDWKGIVDIIGAMDAQALLHSTATTAGTLESASPASMPRRKPASLPATQETLDAWRGRQLIIVVPGPTRVWRLRVIDGAVSGEDVGDARSAGVLATRLYEKPDDLEAAAALQHMVLPRGVTGRVDLLLIGSLSLTPSGVLRGGDRLAQLVRVPGVLPRASKPSRSNGRVIAIGNPTNDLAASETEARSLGTALDAEVYVGTAVTQAVFENARDASVLHVGAHVQHSAEGSSIRLSGNKQVSHRDIAAWARAPRLVVLAGCASSVGRDDADNGSLALAFLEAGAETVITTRWSISDEEAASFVSDFYRLRGATAPVRALHDAQQQTRASRSTWAAFEAFVARPTLSGS
ncbi:MAG: CHAT domain-containing protein [Kofleriaceae bacterium]